MRNVSSLSFPSILLSIMLSTSSVRKRHSLRHAAVWAWNGSEKARQALMAMDVAITAITVSGLVIQRLVKV